MNLNYKNFDWPENFLLDVTIIKTEAEALEILDALRNDKWKDIIFLRYQEKYSCRKLAKKYGFSSQRASALVLNILTKCKQIKKQLQEAETKQEEIKQEEQPSERLIETLNISKREYNCLKRAGINTVEEAIQHLKDYGNFKNIRVIGEAYNKGIITALETIMEEDLE